MKSWMENLEDLGGRLWEQRCREYPAAGERGQALLQDCEGAREKKALLQYILATLPLSDLMDYDPALFLRTLEAALAARTDFPWLPDLPEPFFLLYVAYPRVNNEELADCRALFRRQLEPRVRGLSLEQAVLEVNRWCAQQVTYRSTDDRTSSPLSVYRRGFGRCGEESLFAVTALRSVGIAARQVYAPWWSHCDDNHAWVEVYDGTAWRCLGACEPEPELDRGWFTAAASRAMVIHARTFLRGNPAETAFLFPHTDPVDLWGFQGVVYQGVTQRYGKTRVLTVQVTETSGKPVPNAEVVFSVVNMAGLAEIAVRKTGRDGKTQMRLGMGSVIVSAFSDGKFSQQVVKLTEITVLELVLSEETGGVLPCEMDFWAPAGSQSLPRPLSPLQKELRRAWLDEAEALRARRPQAGPDLSRWEGWECRAFSTLTEKDRAGEAERELLADSRAAFALEGTCSEDVFLSSLLCPRIGLEPLSAWRQPLSRFFSDRERRCFVQEPQLLWNWLEETVREEDMFPGHWGAPLGTLALKAGNRKSRDVLFCALSRSLGVPARLSPLDGQPEFFAQGNFHPVRAQRSAGLTLRAPAGKEALCRRDFTLSRLEKGRCFGMDAGMIPGGESRKLQLVPGQYRLMTVNRMPDGTQLIWQQALLLEPGADREAALVFREERAADLLTCRPLPGFTLKDLSGGGTTLESAELLAGAPFSLLIWLEVGREPTEHILNELAQAAPRLQKWAGETVQVHLIAEQESQLEDRNLKSLLALHSWLHPWQGNFRDDASLLARQMFEDPDKLPFILLADSKGNGLYSSSGYNVGTAELLLRLLEELTGAAAQP